MTTPERVPCPYCPDSERCFSVHGLRVHIGRMHKNIVPQNLNTNDNGQEIPSHPREAGCSLRDLPTLKASVRVLRHVPKGARCLAAGKLVSLIEQCLATNDTGDWCSLMTFPFSALRIPDPSGKQSLTSKVKHNIESSGVTDFQAGPTVRKPPSLYRSVEAKVYEGDLRGAARLLTSDCSLAPANEETLTALKSKHPAPSRQISSSLAVDPSIPCLSVKTEDVAIALGTFHPGSAAGLDGLRPEHLRELISPSAGDNGPRLLESLTRLCNFLLKGLLNPEACPYLYGGSLCALTKKDGGIRPIAVGNTIRRLVAKLCCRAVKLDMSSYLQPHQVGFGTPLGCEAAIHATRMFAMAEDCDNIIIKLDIRNAFNSIERDSILSEVKDLTPTIFPFLNQCYSTSSNLLYNGSSIESQVGAQQGDPLGPLIFSMAIHKAISSLKAPLNVWYLDDGTIGGSPEVVERDISLLFPALKQLGLEVNTEKCEFFACTPAAATSGAKFMSLIPGLRVMDRHSLSLLGAPLFPEGVSDCMQTKRQVMATLAEHLKHLPAHVSLTLVRNCFAMPKLTYIVRTAPTWKHPNEVLAFDGTLKGIVEETLNVCLSEKQWCQACLPIRHGGLGVRRLQETGPVAFLASSHGVLDLVTRILPIHGSEIRIPFASEALEVWSVLCPGASQPDKPERQRSWDEVTSCRLFSDLRDEALGPELARLHAAAKPESGAWLHALPSPHMGTLLDDDSLRVAVALRLGCPICEPHTCICGAKVEANGLHGLSCTRCAGRRPRHHAINEIIRRALVSAEVPCVLEPPGLSRTDGKRPDGLTLIPWQRGRCLIWDATCVCTFAACHLATTEKGAGGAAEAAARGKRAKYSALESMYDFVPFAVETSGPWGAEAKKLIADIGQRLRERGGDTRSGYFLVQRISLAIQRGNSASIMGTFGQGALSGGLFD